MKKHITALMAAALLLSGAGAVSQYTGVSVIDTAITAEAADSFTSKTVSIKADYAASPQAIKISWNKISDAAGYRIYRYTSSGWVGLKNVSASTLSFYEGNLQSGTAYKYMVRAYKKSGSSYIWTKAAGEKYVTTKPKSVVFSAPSSSTSSVTLKWGVQKSNGYQIYYRKHADSSWTYAGATDHMNKNSFTVKSLSSGTQYDFVVRAFRMDNNGRKNDSEFTFITYSTCPANVTFTSACKKENGSAYLVWNKVSGATGYRVYKYNQSKKNWDILANVGSGTNTYTDTNGSGACLRYTVRALKTFGSKTVMSPSYNNLYLASKPSKPGLNYIDATPICVLMASNQNSDSIDGYDIYYRKKGASSWTHYKTTTDGFKQVLYLKGITPGYTYQITVRKYITANGQRIVGDYETHEVTVPKTYSANSYCKKVAEIVNTNRKAQGLKALTLDPQLCSLAMIRAYEQEEEFGHTRPDGSSCFSIVDEYGTASFWGENAAQGQTSPEWVMDSWLNSSGHRANIMGNYTKIGVGYCAKSNSWIQVFA